MIQKTDKTKVERALNSMVITKGELVEAIKDIPDNIAIHILIDETCRKYISKTPPDEKGCIIGLGHPLAINSEYDTLVFDVIPHIDV
ncbi:MAG: hypothetical protein AAGI07_04215 [Bacteroidota bacterium]